MSMFAQLDKIQAANPAKAKKRKRKRKANAAKGAGVGIGIDKHTARMTNMFANIEAHAKAGGSTDYNKAHAAYGNKGVVWDADQHNAKRVKPKPGKKRTRACGPEMKRVSFCARVRKRKTVKEREDVPKPSGEKKRLFWTGKVVRQHKKRRVT